MLPADTDDAGTATRLRTKRNTVCALPVQTNDNIWNSPHELHSKMTSPIPGHCFMSVTPTQN